MIAALGGAPPGRRPVLRRRWSDCGTLWVYDGSCIRGVAVRTGITNGTAVEMLEGR